MDRVLYTTAGMRRAVIALNPATGEMLWMHSEDEGVRGQNAIRTGAGRGVAYWADAKGADRRIIYVTPGYRLKALDAGNGHPIPSFGKNGAVDLKLEADQEIDLNTGEMEKGSVRGYDVRTGKRLWIFHTIPRAGEFGCDGAELLAYALP